MTVTQNEIGFVDRLMQCLTSSELPMLTRRFKRNSSLYVAGEAGASMFIIRGGWVKQVVPDRAGKEFIVDLHTRGDIVGETSLADGLRHDSAVARSDCLVHVLPQNELIEFLRASELLQAWTFFVGERQRRHLEMLSHFVFLDSERRLAARLILLIHRAEPTPDDVVPLHQRISQEEFAAMIGTTRSRVGKFLQRFEEDGLISRSQGRIAVHPRRMRRYLDAYA